MATWARGFESHSRRQADGRGRRAEFGATRSPPLATLVAYRPVKSHLVGYDLLLPSTGTRTRRLSATPREVAGLLDLPLTAVEKAIEQQVVVARTAGHPRSRRLDDGEIAVLALLKDVDVGLPVATKRRLAKWVRAERPDRAETSASLPVRGGLAASVRPEVAREIALAEAYLMARDRWIERNPEIKGGVPVIAGTRISVYGVADRIADGDSIEDLGEEFPAIPAEAFATALAYARFNPRRGRPRAHRPWLAPA